MYKKITLPNGVRIVHEEISHVRSAALGIWIGNGSRFEPAEIGGISHFIEHMIFKGTTSMTASEIAHAMDSIGGQINAFTSKECTSYYVKSLDTHLERAIEIITDMFFNSTFGKAEVDLERTVISEEIGMYEDSPEDIAIEKLFEACFRTSQLGQPILGTNETLENITGEKMHEYMKEYYRPENTVVSICGSYSDEHIKMLCEAFSKMEGSGKLQHEQADYTESFIAKNKDFEQNHICLGFKSLPLADDRRFTLQLLSAMLGGGMSSRLFQEVREKHGLCYSVYTFNSSHLGTGLMSIYTALNANSEEKAIKLIANVLKDFCQNGPTSEEMGRVREQVKANILMGLESTSARMNSTARSELFMDYSMTADELIANYDKVSAEEIKALACEIFDFSKASLCAVGKTRDEDYYKTLIHSLAF